jgi:hypothetical protein
MEHPFINNLDQLDLDQLSQKIGELHKKLAIAHRSGNGYLCDQIRMALDSYTSKHQQKLQEQYRKDSGNIDQFESKIDIS